MAESWKPATAEQTRDAIRWAAAEGMPLELVGGGSKRSFGRPVQADGTLDLSALAGISVYEPEELVLSAGPGTPLAEIEEALSTNGQLMAFEPPDLTVLLGQTPGGGTLGGIVACNLSGPRRIRAGAVRDHVLGLEGVSGRGETFKTGGRVMKNVTGYDLSKLMTGSLGTLGAMTGLTIKVLPMPVETRTVAVLGLDDTTAVAALTQALQSPYEVTGAAHLPKGVALGMDTGGMADAGTSATVLRVEGFPASVDFRCGWLTSQFAARNEVRIVDGDASRALWRSIRDVEPFAAAGDGRQVWRLSVPPASAVAVATRLAAELSAEYFFDWGGGLVWVAIPAADDGGQTTIRAALDGVDGQATLVRAAAPVRAAVDVFQPLPPALTALSERLKDAFDPKRILNPGRMQAGI